ncbi:MAG: uroporphyrinogen decarboxylase family protein [Candidatus Methanomethyliaceae archaeon]
MLKAEAVLSPKERFERTLLGQRTGPVPVAVHWWGTYKYEVSGLDYRRAAWNSGRNLAPIYESFYLRFRPDWFHLHIGTPRFFEECEIVERDNEHYLHIPRHRISEKSEDNYLFCYSDSEFEKIIDFADYLLESRANRPKVDLSSIRRVEEYVKKYISMPADKIIGLGYCDHLAEIAKKYGQEVFIAVHIPSAICEIFDPTTGYLGFEKGLLAFYDHPFEMRRLLELCYEEQLEWAKAHVRCGAHAFIISESFISPDIANPDIYRKFMADIHRDYFGEIKKMGLYPMCHFWGDVIPLLEDLCRINISALLTEESKKSFKLDIREISEKFDPSICLFGNLDSYNVLCKGSASDIKQEIDYQLSSTLGRPFVVANGSPIYPGTPPENVHLMIQYARERSSHDL